MKKIIIFTIALCVSFIFAAQAWTTLDEGLVAYYPFNDNADDESGNGNHGTVHGATLTKDRFGNANSAYYFDGSHDWIKVEPSSSLELADKLTLCVWIKDFNPNSGWEQVVWYGDFRGNNDPYQITLVYGVYGFIVDDTAGRWELFADEPLNLRGWTFLSGTMESLLNGKKKLKIW